MARQSPAQHQRAIAPCAMHPANQPIYRRDITQQRCTSPQCQLGMPTPMMQGVQVITQLHDVLRCEAAGCPQVEGPQPLAAGDGRQRLRVQGGAPGVCVVCVCVFVCVGGGRRTE